jgi:hypothetical protein
MDASSERMAKRFEVPVLVAALLVIPVIAIEREFGRLKNEYGLAPLRVRGIERVALHADLVMLARLASALARARAVPLAA